MSPLTSWNLWSSNMNRTNVQKLTDALRAMEVAMEDVKQAAAAVMNQPDNTTTR